jgi:cell division protein FtsL
LVVTTGRKVLLEDKVPMVPRRRKIKTQVKRKIIRKKRGPMAKVQMFLMSAVLLFFGTGLFLAFEASYLSVKVYQLDQLKKEVANLEKDNEKLKLEVAKLKAPERIAQIATSQLKMQYPNAANVAYLLPPEQKHPDQVASNGNDPAIHSPGENAAILVASPFQNSSFFGSLTRAFEQLLQSNQNQG